MHGNRIIIKPAWLRMGLDTPFWLMTFVAFVTRSLYQTVAGWQEVLVYVLGHAIYYRALYWLIVERFSPWKLALLWLGSPLLLFSATWLRPLWALVFTALWGAALWWSIQQHTSPEKNASEKNTSGGVAGYLIVLAWVSVCGAGGYGYQSSDYVMHNGRLLDLINYAWPVSYVHPDGSQQILVQYAGYYLWPALAGKMAGISAAMFVQHLWLLAGCWIVLRMLVLLGQVRSWIAGVGLLLFGSWDFFAKLLFETVQYPDMWTQLQAEPRLGDQVFSMVLNGIPGTFDFWPADVMSEGIWFGNFISLTSSVLWAPHQVVAGWITVGLLCRACCQQQIAACLFACALLAYYSPMIALGVLPMVLVLLAWQLINHRWYRRDIFPVLVGVTVLGVLGIYYTSVPANAQPHGVLPFSHTDLFVFALFLLQGWGMHLILVVLYRRWLDKNMKAFACAVFIAAIPLSCVYYGVYNDLMVRSSAAIYCGILLVLLAILRSLWLAGAYWRIVFFVILLLPSMLSGALSVWQAVHHADERVIGQRVVDYGGGWQFLGKQDSWFVRYLSADSPLKESE